MFKAILKTYEGNRILKCSIIGLIMGIMSASSGLDYAVIFVILMPIYINLLYWGWKALDSITPRMFLVLPIIGWVIYYIAKFMLAMIVGWVAFPKAIIAAFREAREQAQ